MYVLRLSDIDHFLAMYAVNPRFLRCRTANADFVKHIRPILKRHGFTLLRGIIERRLLPATNQVKETLLLSLDSKTLLQSDPMKKRKNPAAVARGRARWKGITLSERSKLVPRTGGRPRKYPPCKRYRYHVFSPKTNRCPCGFRKLRQYRPR